jgi:cytochrome c-type biogenesis protein CcmH/NrfG
MNLKLSVYCIVFFSLSACNIQNLQQSNTDLEHIVKVEQQANSAYQNEDWQTAENAYLELAQKTPSQADPWFRLGNIYARTERLDAAVTAYREALLRDQKNSKVWHNLGVVQLRQATNTFIEMMEYTDTSDPLNQRASYALKSMKDLLTSGFEVPDSE